MKKLYSEYFHIPKHGIIRDRVMLVRAAVAVIVMLICLAGMSLTAYAYFSVPVSTAYGTIKSASFAAEVSVSEDDGTAVTVGEDGNVELQAGKKYTVTLKHGGTAETGFCVVTAEGSSQTYHTQQLGTDAAAEGGKTESITFSLEVTEKTTVTFLSHWGTSSHYDAYKAKCDGGAPYIAAGNAITLEIVPA